LFVLAKEVGEALPGDYLPPCGSLLFPNEGKKLTGIFCSGFLLSL
jgi:hypothetical protein